MNLFVTDPSPTLAAQALDDVRLRKMVLETAQMLCTELARRGWKGMPYKPTHIHHPVVLSLQNDGTYEWAVDHFYALADEYSIRFGKPHASYLALRGKCPFNAVHLPPTFHNSARNLSLGLDFTHLPIFDAYRAYLNARWAGDKRAPVWTKRNPPDWRI